MMCYNDIDNRQDCSIVPSNLGPNIATSYAEHAAVGQLDQKVALPMKGIVCLAQAPFETDFLSWSPPHHFHGHQIG